LKQPSSTAVKASAFRRFANISAGFWWGRRAARAWFLTILVFAFLIGQIASQVGMNAWTRTFFDALEKKDVTGVWTVVAALPLLLLALIASLSGVMVTRMLLQMRWREWLTDKIAGWWIADQRYYRLGFVAEEQQAPEYRIADDVRLATEPVVEFALSLTGAALTALSFATILWQVAGSWRLELGGSVIEIPGYMAWAAILYAITASVMAYFVGRPLVGAVAAKNEREARFRAELTRLRENAESIALIRGDADELGQVRLNYKKLLSAWLGVIRRQGWISLVLHSNSALFPIVPLLLIAPKYLSGELSFGAVMQVVAAFGSVQLALIWFVDRYVPLAEWFASAQRVLQLTDALIDIDVGTIMEDDSGIRFARSEDGAVHLENLSIADRAGRTMINGATAVIAQGEKVMLAGESGAGKSTLIRAIAGLWPWGSGQIKLPSEASIAFLPQRPYLPVGTLRQALTYPKAELPVSDDDMAAAMRRCGLDYLVKRLDEADIRWDQTLSGGERQRVAFCRLVLQKPQVIIMDEATSALDEGSQHAMLSLLRDELKNSTVISVGHRTGIEEFHDRKLTLEKKPAGAQMRSKPVQAASALSRLLQKLR
jgi:putative ATP-binding cassette transporter